MSLYDHRDVDDRKHLQHQHDLHNRDIGLFKRAMQLRDLRSFVHAQIRAFVVNKTGMSTTLSRNEYDACNCESRLSSHRQHTWNLLDLPNSDVDIHQWTATEESHGFLNNQDQGDIHCATIGMWTTLTPEDCARGTAQQQDVNNQSKSSTWKTRRSSAQFAL